MTDNIVIDVMTPSMSILKVEEVVVTHILVMVGQMESQVNMAQEVLVVTMAEEVLVAGLMSQPFQ